MRKNPVLQNKWRSIFKEEFENEKVAHGAQLLKRLRQRDIKSGDRPIFSHTSPLLPASPYVLHLAAQQLPGWVRNAAEHRLQ